MIRGIRWARAGSIVRKARGSDNWPLAWGDDDRLYTAYGDGNGFEPFLSEKLSLGLKAMRVLGIAAPAGPASEAGTGAGRVPRR